jgi:DNA-3-methyladenine glycosylase II
VVANTPAEALRACGFSASKVIYMHALAMYFIENKAIIKRWPEMSDAEIIKELTSIKGIGVWTAEMFLIFALGRPDVLPLLDIGLLKGVYRAYNNSEKMTKAEVAALGENWRPYRSVATWYLWRSLDPVPVAY